MGRVEEKRNAYAGDHRLQPRRGWSLPVGRAGRLCPRDDPGRALGGPAFKGKDKRGLGAGPSACWPRRRSAWSWTAPWQGGAAAVSTGT